MFTKNQIVKPKHTLAVAAVKSLFLLEQSVKFWQYATSMLVKKFWFIGRTAASAASMHMSWK